ncbi:hypothetical protein BP00DRAFT_68295 [Aspergillus indologenus CBS 114.80]|uniref:Uncharacterized protein n=1 Tax=Aspergillus indologenus CBS 114.80 TaxID=1450541 RepID=A0A2V5HP36_9EURO|nr:hypothetical protein BP00DRAFT_68295 [Aspergillus indologenus CBS 114.80]
MTVDFRMTSSFGCRRNSTDINARRSKGHSPALQPTLVDIKSKGVTACAPQQRARSSRSLLDQRRLRNDPSLGHCGEKDFCGRSIRLNSDTNLQAWHQSSMVSGFCGGITTNRLFFQMQMALGCMQFSLSQIWVNTAVALPANAEREREREREREQERVCG